MANTYISGFLGHCTLKVRARIASPDLATVPVTTGDRYFIPVARVLPFNILGNVYPAVVNASSFPTIKYSGKVRAGFTIVAYIQPSFFTKAFLDDLLAISTSLQTITAPNQTPMFDMRLVDGESTRYWNWARCSDVRITLVTGGPGMLSIGFLSRWGPAEAGLAGMPTSGYLPDGEAFPAAINWALSANTYTVQPGQVMDITRHDFKSDSSLRALNPAGDTSGVVTASHVRSAVISLMRGCNPVDYSDGYDYPKDIAVGGFGGALSVEQNPASGVVIPSTAMSVRFNTDQASPIPLRMDLATSFDSIERGLDPGIVTMVRNFQLFAGAGTTPVTLTAYTPA